MNKCFECGVSLGKVSLADCATHRLHFGGNPVPIKLSDLGHAKRITDLAIQLQSAIIYARDTGLSICIDKDTSALHDTPYKTLALFLLGDGMGGNYPSSQIYSVLSITRNLSREILTDMDE